MFRWIRSHKIDIAILQETHCGSTEDATAWTKEWGQSAWWTTTSTTRCGVAILARALQDRDLEMARCVEESEGRIITVQFNFTHKEPLHVTGIYAPATPADRTPFFESLAREVRQRDRHLIGGDFNCAPQYWLDKSSASNVDRGQRSLAGFVAQRDLVDVWRTAHPNERQYTWRNASGSICTRIDLWWATRSLCATVERCYHMPFPLSDHQAVCLCLPTNQPGRGCGSWKLNTSLLADPALRDMVHACWREWRSQKARFADLGQWWDLGKNHLRSVCQSFSSLMAQQTSADEIALEKELIALYTVEHEHSSELVRAKISDVEHKLRQLQLTKAKGARIRAKIQQVEEGEQPTRFFLKREQQRSAANVVTRIQTKDGSLDSSRADSTVLSCFSDFYARLFGGDGVPEEHQRDFFANLPPAPDGPVDGLEAAISLADLHRALLSMPNEKSPGLDGLPAEFYRQYWDILGPDLHSVLSRSYATGMLPLSMRRSIVSPIHKRGERHLLENWRPISLLNTDYKIIAKAMANQLKAFLPEVIDESQSAFVPGRNIATNISCIRDAIFWANETNARCAIIFLDWQKAYDRVDWSFIQKTLEYFKIGPRFSRMVGLLYREVFTAVKHNGQISSFRPVRRGVRQGCPLSPALYVLVAETLGIALRTQADYQGLVVNNARVKTSQFADDTALVLGANGDFAAVDHSLRAYERASGSRLNRDKTWAMWAGSWRGRHDNPFPGISWLLQGKYLGVYVGADSLEAINTTWNMVTNKLISATQLWKGRPLTIFGRAVVVNTILLSRIVYTASVYHLPARFRMLIEATIWRFVWSNAPDGITRDWATRPQKQGGLGIGVLLHRLRSLQAAWLGRLLAVCSQHERTEELAAHPWAHLARAALVRSHCLGESSLPTLEWLCSTRVQSHLTVNNDSNFWEHVVSSWASFAIQQGDSLLSQPPSQWSPRVLNLRQAGRRDPPPPCKWKAVLPTPPGNALVASVWSRMVVDNPTTWNTRQFVWRLLHRLLPVRERLVRHGRAEEETCLFCGREQESLAHLFAFCPLTKSAYFRFLLLTNKLGISKVSLTDVVFGFSAIAGSTARATVFNVVLSLFLQAIWGYRCDVLARAVSVTDVQQMSIWFRFGAAVRSLLLLHFERAVEKGTVVEFQQLWCLDGALCAVENGALKFSHWL